MDNELWSETEFHQARQARGVWCSASDKGLKFEGIKDNMLVKLKTVNKLVKRGRQNSLRIMYSSTCTFLANL